MSDQLRTTAQISTTECLLWYFGSTDPSLIREQMEKLLRICGEWNAEHPADDETLVDEAWLTSILSVSADTGNWTVRRSAPTTFEIELDGRAFWLWFAHDEVTPVPLRQMKTRGDVRRLLAALDVSLQEKKRATDLTCPDS